MKDFVKRHHLDGKEKERFINDHRVKEEAYLRFRRSNIKAEHFLWLAMIGAGTFAEVFLCQHIATGQIVAMKKIRKDTIKEFAQATRLTTERAILGASTTPWLVKLYYAFTDPTNIYLGMVLNYSISY